MAQLLAGLRAAHVLSAEGGTIDRVARSTSSAAHAPLHPAPVLSLSHRWMTVAQQNKLGCSAERAQPWLSLTALTAGLQAKRWWSTCQSGGG